MPVIYLKHPIHGNKVAIAEEEARADEKKGWERYEVAALLREPVRESVENVTVEGETVNALTEEPKRRGRPKKAA